MNVFKDYALYYNLLYRDKNYQEEVTYIHNVIQEMKADVKSVLDLGCGTGNHDVLLSNYGYDITGIDISETMIAMAKPHEREGALRFSVCDACEYKADKKFDAVISLFHVINYQSTNKALISFFNTAHASLNPGGIFIFDAWYGPALLTDKPFEKTKVIEDDHLKITRFTKPELDVNANIAHINFMIDILDKHTGATASLKEKHSMRYLFYPEIEMLASQTGFRIVKFSKWMDTTTPGEGSWYVILGLVKN